MKKYLLFLAMSSFLMSCTKEIDIDLNEINPRYIIEGTISNVTGEAKVTIKQTINFNENIPFPTISGAVVTILNTKTNTLDTLKESTKGLYTNSRLVGQEGVTYTLTLKIGAETFVANSTMPQKVALDTLIQVISSSSSGGGRGSFGGPKIVEITPKYFDPADVQNYYQFVVTRNDTLLNDVFIRNDVGFNGSASDRPLQVAANPNDLVKVDMHCIDKPVYNYFFGLNENINQSSATPANPVSNINNGALGYFKAHTTQKQQILIK